MRGMREEPPVSRIASSSAALNARGLERSCENVDRALDAVLDHLLELRTRQPDGGVDLTDEQRNDGFGIEGEGFFGLDALAPQRRETDSGGGVRRQRGRGQTRGGDRVAQDDVVEVRAAEVGDAEGLADDPHAADPDPCAG